MSIINTIKNFFTSQHEAEKTINESEIKKEIVERGNLFTCHHCGNQFEFSSKDIFPTSVRLLYKDQYVTGKGIICPECKQNSIFG